LFAALESIKPGHGGDSVLADFLGLDPHTVARFTIVRNAALILSTGLLAPQAGSAQRQRRSP
jgi:hypothetical protein